MPMLTGMVNDWLVAGLVMETVGASRLVSRSVLALAPTVSCHEAPSVGRFVLAMLPLWTNNSAG